MIIHNPILTGSLTLNNVNLSTGNLVTTGSNTFVGNQILSGSLTVSGSVSATGTLTAQTLVVQTVTSSVLYSSGSNVFGNNIANTQVMTGSVTVTGSLAVVTNGTELQVTNTGVRIGNVSTDAHLITGSVNVSGSATFSSSVTAASTLYLGNDGTYGSTYRTLGLTGITNGTHRIFAGTADNLYIAAATGRDIVFWTDGSSGTKASISTTGAATFSSTAQNAFLINSTNTDGPILQIQNSGNNLGLIGNAEGITNGGATNFAIRATNNLIFSTGGANPRMTITSGGNVGIGTSDVKAWGSSFTAIQLNATCNIHGTPGSEGRIVNNLWWDGVNWKYLVSSVGGTLLNLDSSGAYVFLTAASGTAGANATLNTRMTITNGGNIGAPSGTNIYNASDLRFKRNITTIENGVDKVMKLNPVMFNWIEGYEPSEENKDMLGFIAQEVQNAVPQAVEIFSDGSTIKVGNLEVENPLRVNEKFIIPVLVKAIQELKAQIEELKSQINK
jgi:hypothetical protein